MIYADLFPLCYCLFYFLLVCLFLFPLFLFALVSRSFSSPLSLCSNKVKTKALLYYFTFILFLFCDFSFFLSSFLFSFSLFFLLSNVKGSFGSKTETVVPLNHQFFIVFFFSFSFIFNSSSLFFSYLCGSLFLLFC